jgi:hypothetical protein
MRAGVVRILAYAIVDGMLAPAAALEQSDGDEPRAWESSGIINVLDGFGEGSQGS